MYVLVTFTNLIKLHNLSLGELLSFQTHIDLTLVVIGIETILFYELVHARDHTGRIKVSFPHKLRTHVTGERILLQMEMTHMIGFSD